MAIIKGKVTKAVVQNGIATITIQLKDESNFVWEKTYKYNTTSTINLVNFKDRLKADIVKDLKLENQLEEILPIVNKEFTLNI